MTRGPRVLISALSLASQAVFAIELTMVQGLVDATPRADGSRQAAARPPMRGPLAMTQRHPAPAVPATVSNPWSGSGRVRLST